MKKFFRGILIIGIPVLIAYLFLVFLPQAFAGESIPSPVAFNVLGLTVRWYGLIIASAIVICYFVASKWFSKIDIKTEKSDGAILAIAVLGLIGARAAYVLQNLHYFGAHLNEVYQIWGGGLSIHGAIIGGLIGVLVGAKIYKIKFLELANIVAPQVLLGAAIGRWGNFFNEEIVGRPTNVRWKMYVLEENRPTQFAGSAFFHPVFLYESLLLFLAFGAYLLIRRKFGNGFGLIYTLIGYSVVRFIVQFWRYDHKAILLGLDLAQWVSIGLIIIGLILLFFYRPKK